MQDSGFWILDSGFWFTLVYSLSYILIYLLVYILLSGFWILVSASWDVTAVTGGSGPRLFTHRFRDQDLRVTCGDGPQTPGNKMLSKNPSR